MPSAPHHRPGPCLGSSSRPGHPAPPAQLLTVREVVAAAVARAGSGTPSAQRSPASSCPGLSTSRRTASAWRMRVQHGVPRRRGRARWARRWPSTTARRMRYAARPISSRPSGSCCLVLASAAGGGAGLEERQVRARRVTNARSSDCRSRLVEAPSSGAASSERRDPGAARGLRDLPRGLLVDGRGGVSNISSGVGRRSAPTARAASPTGRGRRPAPRSSTGTERRRRRGRHDQPPGAAGLHPVSAHRRLDPRPRRQRAPSANGPVGQGVQEDRAGRPARRCRSGGMPSPLPGPDRRPPGSLAGFPRRSICVGVEHPQRVVEGEPRGRPPTACRRPRRACTGTPPSAPTATASSRRRGRRAGVEHDAVCAAPGTSARPGGTPAPASASPARSAGDRALDEGARARGSSVADPLAAAESAAAG